jgi:hypothetical protein
MWGGVPVVGLSADVIGHLLTFRKRIEDFSEVFEYHTFPRAALLNKVAVTALLSRAHARLDIKLKDSAWFNLTAPASSWIP